MQVKFYDDVEDVLLRFAVIISKVDTKWVFCKHKERDTYEVPGGHRESGEPILETAKRELREETGAVDFTIEPICVYSVTGKNRINDTGELFFDQSTEQELMHLAQLVADQKLSMDRITASYTRVFQASANK